MIVHIDNQTPEPDGYAAARTLGLYNVGVEDATRFRMDVDVPVEKEDWHIGVIVGPSGSGKTSIARALADTGSWFDWSPEWSAEPVIEELTRDGEYGKATAALAAVGLGSVPSWLRPHHVLSNGEGFRANMAKLLLLSNDIDGAKVVIDEFTSVLDRQVAKVGAGAFAKAWRRKPDRRVILITPHYDILDWVQPDWWIDTAEGADEFASDRGVVTAREGEFQAALHHGGYSGDRVATLEC